MTLKQTTPQPTIEDTPLNQARQQLVNLLAQPASRLARVVGQVAQPLTLSSELGRGGEATVYHVANFPRLVAKIYHQPTSARAGKLRAMLHNPPEQPKGHVAIAWPVALIYRTPAGLLAAYGSYIPSNGRCIGFLMPKIIDGYSIFHLYNPVMRQQLPYSFNWQALHRTALNLCAVVQAIHAKGYVIGDLNESNILVNREALVTLVDCDSFQVTDEHGTVHRCPVGKPEYTPPELVGLRLSAVDQTEAHDLFGLAVLLFQLLMEGYHPFAGVLQSAESVGRVDLYAIREGLFPYDQAELMKPPPSAPPPTMLYPPLQEAFRTCFVDGYRTAEARPTAFAWRSLLKLAEGHLISCQRHASHVYSSHLSRCPWCEQKRPVYQKKPTNSSATSRQAINITKQLAQAERAYQHEDAETVVRVLTPLIDAGVAPVEAYEYRVWGYFKLRDYQSALNDGLLAMERGANRAETPFLMGLCSVELGHDDWAVRYFTQAIRENYEPRQEVHYHRAKTYERLGRNQKTINNEWLAVFQIQNNSYWWQQARNALEQSVHHHTPKSSRHQPAKKGRSRRKRDFHPIDIPVIAVAFYIMFMEDQHAVGIVILAIYNFLKALFNRFRD